MSVRDLIKRIRREPYAPKRAEEELVKERERINLIISSMGEGLLVVDRQRRVTMINPAAEKLLEIRKEDALGRDWSEIVSTLKDVAKTPTKERSFARSLATGEVIITHLDDNHYYLTRSGRRFPIVSITAPIKSNGEIIGAVKVFRDATPEKESKRIIEEKVEERTRQLREAHDKISEGLFKLQEEEARLTASINSLPLGFFIIDKDHKIVLVNPAMKEILGKSEENWTFEKLKAGFKDSGIDLSKFCAHCRGNASPYRLNEVDYGSKILQIISVPIVMSEKSVIGSAIVIEDITEEKLLQRSKDEFFAVASHELRTPLTAIRGNTALIQQYFADKIKNKDLLEMIADMHESSLRLINIVNDFLNVSRLEQEKIEFKREEIDLEELVKESFEELKSAAGKKGLYLKLQGPGGGLAKASGDRDRVKEVILNLLNNAINFTEKGGVTVKIGRGDSFLEVAVKDSGVGISKKNQKLLFKKFQQAGERILARDVTRGTGMGLYISKLLIEGMGGKIYLESSGVGKGSTFAFRLPIAKVE